MRIARKNLALSATMVLFTLVLLEAGFQAFPSLLPDGLSYTAQRTFIRNYGDLRTWVRGSGDRDATLFTYHPTLGWAGRPNLDLTEWSLDGAFRLRTDALGFRDLDRGPPAEDRTRIVVLGDSFVWGLPLDQDKLLPQLLERNLRDAGIAADVYNLGVNGYGTDQEYLAYKTYGASYRPHLVVLSFFYSNDFLNHGASVSSYKAKPYITIGEHGSLEAWLRGR